MIRQLKTIKMVVLHKMKGKNLIVNSLQLHYKVSIRNVTVSIRVKSSWITSRIYLINQLIDKALSLILERKVTQSGQEDLNKWLKQFKLKDLKHKALPHLRCKTLHKVKTNEKAWVLMLLKLKRLVVDYFRFWLFFFWF